VVGKDRDSEFVETLQMVVDLSIPVSLVEIIWPEVTIGDTFGKNVISGDKR
jgi:hypothetical protein